MGEGSGTGRLSPKPCSGYPSKPHGLSAPQFGEGVEGEKEHFFVSGQGRDGWKLPTPIAPASLCVPACLLGKISLLYRAISTYIFSSQQQESDLGVCLLPGTAPGKLKEAQPSQPSPFPPSPKVCPCWLSSSQSSHPIGALCLLSFGEREVFHHSGRLGKPSWPPTAISTRSSCC